MKPRHSWTRSDARSDAAVIILCTIWLGVLVLCRPGYRAVSAFLAWNVDGCQRLEVAGVLLKRGEDHIIDTFL